MLVASQDSAPEATGWVGLSGRAPGNRPLEASLTRLGCPRLPWAWSVCEVGMIGWVSDRKEVSLCSYLSRILNLEPVGPWRESGPRRGLGRQGGWEGTLLGCRVCRDDGVWCI